MPWKKIIVSGSSAELSTLKVDGVISGSVFSGSFVGDGAGLTGLSSGVTNFGLEGNGTSTTFDMTSQNLHFTSASSHGFGFTVSGSTDAAFVKITTPQDLRTTASPTFANGTYTGDVSVTGNLTVLGNVTELQVTNVNVEDKFILLNSGSSTGDGGIIIQSGSSFTGVAVGWDESAARWGVQQNTQLASNATSLSPEAYMGLIIDIDGGMTDSITYQKRGNIKIASGEAYIFV